MRTRQIARARTDVDMTPMLDIVFIMLIFFVVTATFTRESGLMMSFPAGHAPTAPNPNRPIGFQIDATGRLFHEGRLIDPWSIEAIVKEGHTSRPDVPVVVETHANADTRHMVRVYDEAVKAGMPTDRIAVRVEGE